MAKIAIELSIDCEKETCGNCNFLDCSFSRGFICKVFHEEVTEKDGAFMRLPECKQAEVKDE